MKTKYLILGAGPAGLTFAQCLKRQGIEDFIVVEKEETVGGLCRSEDVDGSPLDIGGGHFLDVRRPRVNEFLFSFMPEEEWDRYSRDSRIAFKLVPPESTSGKKKDYELHHPFEANIWELPKSLQKKYLESSLSSFDESTLEMASSALSYSLISRNALATVIQSTFPSSDSEI